MPEFPAMGKDNPLICSDMHFIDSTERIERAYDDWKNGRWSRDPYCDTLLPTMTDPTMAPPGKHYMSVFVQYAPIKLSTGEWTDQDRDDFGSAVIDQIAEYSPNLKDLIVHAEVRSPQDIENEIGLTAGNIFQGELTMDQMFLIDPSLVMLNTEVQSKDFICVAQPHIQEEESWQHLVPMQQGKCYTI